MESCHRGTIAALLFLLPVWTSVAQTPVGTGFSFQGHLKESGIPVNGTVDLRFRLYDAGLAGNLVGAELLADDQPIDAGNVHVDLDFGSGIFNGDARWLEIDVRNGNSTGPYDTLAPRQLMGATPYAQYALNIADGAGNTLDQAYDQGGPGAGKTISADSGAIRINGDGLLLDGPFSSSNHSLNIYAVTTGDTIHAHNDGGGRGGLFLSSLGSGIAVSGRTVGIEATSSDGPAGSFSISLAGNNSPAVEATTNGGGGAGRFTFDNPADGGYGVIGTSNGTSGSVGVEGIGTNGAEGVIAFSFGTGNALRAQVVGGGTGLAGRFIGLENNGTDAVIQIVSPGQSMRLDGNEIDSNVNLYLNNNNANNVILARGGGGVGIGTNTIPTGVRLAVDGKVLCEELEVQLSQDWPDFVFADDYELMPIDELEASLKQNRRLPGMPSASEVKRNGLKVGQMQASLLEKVEQLTLYVIDLNKQVETVRRENEALRRQLQVQREPGSKGE